MPPDGGRPAAALLLIYPVDAIIHVLLTVRSRDLPNHRGQISLPGGLVEEEESLRSAALREAREEVGLVPELVHVLGSLSAVFIPVSGFILHPFVGTVRERPKLRPSPHEVERLLEVPLAELLDPARLHVESRVLLGRDARVPYFDLEGEKLWGATAMVLAEFLWILGAPPAPADTA
jgi:8-oxo-dGTP pyrophosphatase MutT (NUDIX family)